MKPLYRRVCSYLAALLLLVASSYTIAAVHVDSAPECAVFILFLLTKSHLKFAPT